MNRVRLYTVFHANLDFSAIPEREVPTVLDRCYWPLISIAEEASIPLGLEMPSRTLARLSREDPEWVKALRSLVDRGAIEIVGSGRAQVIGPLVPLDVNRANFALGAREYEHILGRAPTTWFVNEQTWSRGLPALYAEAGARTVVMEWNNPASRRPELRPLRGRPARVDAGGGRTLDLLWNDCVVFQRLQRAAHGSLPLSEYASMVERLASDPAAEALCAYGGDLEIFDYRPGGAEPADADQGREMTRLRRALEALSCHPDLAFALPRDVAGMRHDAPIAELASPEEPIPCKKQPRYNPTRWAVSGRDGLGMNRRCFELRRRMRATRALAASAGASWPDEDAASLVDLWRSDLRTRATEEKLTRFHDQLGEADARVQARLGALAPTLAEGWDAVLQNPWPDSWAREPVEVEVTLPPGRCLQARVASDSPDALSPERSQVDVLDRHRDGSARRVLLVVAPELAPGQTLRIRAEAARPGEPERETSRTEPCRVEPDGVETEAVSATFLPGRGGALAAARFAATGGDPLIGTLPHGSFDDVAHTPDFYSGHVVGHAEGGAKLTSLEPAEVMHTAACGPLRACISFRVRAPFGSWITHYRVYRDRPRIDLVHELELRELRLHTLRLGVATWLPDAFDRSSLGYATVDGGAELEHFDLGPGVRVEHGRPVSPTVTASSCLGATEGWISAGDASRGVAIIGDRAAAAVVPMVDFGEVDDRFLLRIHHSAAETDETRASFFRGTLRIPFALVAHRNQLDGVRETARAIDSGLVCRTGREVGLARAL